LVQREVHLCGVRGGLTDPGDWAIQWIPAEWRDFVELSAREADEQIRSSTHAGRPLGSVGFVQSVTWVVG
jgi:hypothetical protein